MAGYFLFLYYTSTLSVHYFLFRSVCAFRFIWLYNLGKIVEIEVEYKSRTVFGLFCYITASYGKSN